MLIKYLLFVPALMTIGWIGTRAAYGLHRAKSQRSDVLFLLVLVWSPTVIWLIALLLSRSGSLS